MCHPERRRAGQGGKSMSADCTRDFPTSTWTFWILSSPSTPRNFSLDPPPRHRGLERPSAPRPTSARSWEASTCRSRSIASSGSEPCDLSATQRAAAMSSACVVGVDRQPPNRRLNPAGSTVIGSPVPWSANQTVRPQESSKTSSSNVRRQGASGSSDAPPCLHLDVAAGSDQQGSPRRVVGRHRGARLRPIRNVVRASRPGLACPARNLLRTRAVTVRVRVLMARLGPVAVFALTLLLAACQKSGGASGGPGY